MGFSSSKHCINFNRRISIPLCSHMFMIHWQQNPNSCWIRQAGLPALKPTQVMELLPQYCGEEEAFPLPCWDRAVVAQMGLLRLRPLPEVTKVWVDGGHLWMLCIFQKQRLGSSITTGSRPTQHHSTWPEMPVNWKQGGGMGREREDQGGDEY